ncbi:PA0061/PA0062 family lipoprotein [Pseudomonas sp. S2_C03]
MRKMMLTGSLLMLTGCAGFGLPHHDPSQAWIDLDSPQQDTALQALEVDAKASTDKRYFEVQPGSHELTVRYQFAVEPSNIGPGAETLWRDCQMNVKFNGFNAGEKYQLQAGNIGFRPWAKLYDQQRNVIGQGTPAGCQRT